MLPPHRARGVAQLRPRRVALPGLLVIALTVGACSRSSDTTAEPTPSAPPAVPSTKPPTLPTPPTTAAPIDTSAGAALEAVWRDTPGGCLQVTVGGDVVYEANPDEPVRPASLAKLFTGAAAVDGLGINLRLRTSVHALAAPDPSGVTSDLWLIGGGDPVLGTDAWAAQLRDDRRLYTSLDELADRVVAAGVRRVEGRIIGDDSRYDRDRYVDTWPTRLIDDGEVGPLSALTVNDGFRTWGHPGIPFDEPAADAAAIFADLLVSRGVDVTGPAAAGTASGATVELAAVESPAVGALVDAMLRDSDNGTAELLVKELGFRWVGEGVTDVGTRVIYDLLVRGGVLPTPGVVIADGSGLSDAARASCRALTTLLDRRSVAISPRLATAGRDGTLARRFTGTPAAGRIRAKTGSIDGIAALAGYAETNSGTTATFAYVVNGLEPGASARRQQEALATILVTML